jgi:feruloyl esterase
MHRISAIVVMAAAVLATPFAARAASGVDCVSLTGYAVPASAIGLKTTGAAVQSATVIDDPRNGLFCKVVGVIHPVDPKAPEIEFQLNLPAQWNRKALQIGGGGYNGTVVTAEASRYPDPDAPTPLKQGYATFGSDSGHKTVKGQDAAAFASNAEALANFGGDQLKKTRDVAVAVMTYSYGAAPRRIYFQGSSQGGHEGFTVMQRWPADYDGVIAIHPVYDFTALQTTGTLLGQAIYNTPGGWLPPEKVVLVHDAVYAACDALDGLKDGVIANVKACAANFHIASLRCPGGGDTGMGCLSDPQIRTLETFNSERPLGVTLQGGVDRFARWPVFEGADMRRFNLGKGLATGDAFVYTMGDQMVRYMAVGDPRFNSLTFNPRQNAAALQRVSKLVDANEADISAFEKRGGKLLLIHGTVDMAVTPYNSIAYYNRLVQRFGREPLRRFVRFYIAPGFGHGDGPFQVGWDSLGTLDAWVDKGREPGPQTVVDTAKDTAGRHMPLCEYPTWPKYNGAGDPKAASSFSCTGS